VTPEQSSICERFQKVHPRCQALWERASRLIPGGITHDIRYLTPFPIYVARAEGARKWDVDGQEYVDYWMGHGALFLGHSQPRVVAAVQAQMALGTHPGACHELEIRWAQLVNQLVPCAELVRFTMSGTESTHLAMRLARAHTGKPKVLKFHGHFHGWHDGVVGGVQPPYDQPVSAGVSEATLGEVLLCQANDVKQVEELFQRGDVAALIMEPAGGHSGDLPTLPGVLENLRALTARYGVVLIFDEVITCFRYAPGGAQAYFGVTPDLTTLAKILAGGLPGGAVAGRREIMSLIAHRNDPVWDRGSRVAHAGTFNANPLSAVAGITTLELLADGEAQRRANKTGATLRSELGALVRRLGVPAEVYGESSIYHLSFEGLPGPSGFDKPRNHALYYLLRCALLLEGVDAPLFHSWISATHTEEEVHRTVKAYENALKAMASEGAFR